MKFAHLFLVGILLFGSANADDVNTSKKGICLGKGKGDARDKKKKLEKLNVGWHYNWTGGYNGPKIKDAPFVPMVWGNNKWSMDKLRDHRVSKSKMDVSPLLGFNEPDGKKQSNLSVDQAIKLWPKLEETKRRLGSPVTVHPDNEWMKSFMAKAKEQNLRVDFICVHWYGGNDPDGFINRLKKVHQLYGKPIWITEFAVADWSAKTRKDNKHTPEDILKFMKNVLPRLEKLDFVERYAWFTSMPDQPKLGPSALYTKDDELTELGKFYAAHE